MLTPQEVSTRTFTKVRIGGYNMMSVDEFLDTLTEDYNTLYKENTALKAKMKVLVDKVEEYRATEESMRATLLSAQKMADQLVQEAQEEREQILGDLQSEIDARKAEGERIVRVEEERLRVAKEEFSTFITQVRRFCHAELKCIDTIAEQDIVVTAEQDAMEETQKSDEKTSASIQEERDKEEQRDAAEEKVQQSQGEHQEHQEDADGNAAKTIPMIDAMDDIPAIDIANGMTDEDLSVTRRIVPEDFAATRRIDFGDLQFGRNYKQRKR